MAVVYVDALLVLRIIHPSAAAAADGVVVL